MHIKISKCTVAPANRVYMVDLLGGVDLQTARGRYENLIDEVLALMPERAPFVSKDIFHLKCINLNEVNSLFFSISRQCNSETSPLIFIDGHGHKENGLMLPSGEYLTWGNLNFFLERITLSACGNSTVVASFCYSMNAVNGLSYERPPPSPFYYGYADEVQAGVIEEEGVKIVKEFLQAGMFDKKGKTIELYSEYEHVLPLVSALVIKFLCPQKMKNFLPELSKGNLRNMLQKDIGENFKKTRGLNKILPQVFNLRALIEPILNSAMYATDRRYTLLNDLLRSIDLEMQKTGQIQP